MLSFEIQLNKPQPVYAPGEHVAGQLFIKLSKRVKINSLKLLLKGQFEVWWTTRTIHETIPHIPENTISHHSSNVYVYEERTMIDDKESEKEFGPGEVNFPFTFQLPLNLPTSFENLDGHIRYWFRAALDMPWTKTKYIYQTITVLCPIDLNQMTPNIRESCSIRNEFPITKLFSKTDHVYVDVSLKKSGFVPGESIDFDVKVENAASSKIESVSAALVKHLTLRSGGEENKSTKTVAWLELATNVEPGAKLNFQNSQLKTSAMCPTNLKMCKNIEVFYTFDINIDHKVGKERKIAKIPVVIGTIPLLDGNKISSKNKLDMTYAIANDDLKSKCLFKPLYPLYLNFDN